MCIRDRPITIDVEKDYFYKLGLKKSADNLKKANKRADQLAKEKAVLIAKATKAIKEKAALAAKTAKEKAALQAKANKAAKEKAALVAKTAKEKAALQAKVEAEKKASIQKMQANTTLSNEEIMEFLNLDKKTFKQYLQEIKEE